MTLKTEVDTETQAPTPKLAVSSLKWLAEKADITEAVNVDDIQVHVMTRYNQKLVYSILGRRVKTIGVADT